IGISSWCKVLGIARGYDELQNLPVAGTYSDIIEDIMRRADLVLFSGGYQRILADKLRMLGVHYYVAQLPKTVWDIADMILQIAASVNCLKRGMKLAGSFTSKLMDTKKEFRRFPGVKVLVELNLGEPTLPGFFSHIITGLEFLGLQTLNSHFYEPYIAGTDAARIAKSFIKKAEIIIYEDNTLKPDLHNAIDRLVKFHDLSSSTKIVVLPTLTLTDYGPRFVDSLRFLGTKIMEFL
ncbi:MAG: hypothetical protein J7L55_05460, partial [Desulfurococcales archaeon]|nr:hypothetical protein [Desulfurococcales archaeon]